MVSKVFSKDPAEVLDYTFGFGPSAPGAVPPDPGWLAPGDFLQGTPEITISGPDALLTISTPAVIQLGNLSVLVWLAGGTSDVYTVWCKCPTAQNRTVRKSIQIVVRPG